MWLLIFLGFFVPSAFLLVGAFAKKLIGPSAFWEWQDWYLGLEFTLVAVTACTINACDLYRLGEKAESQEELNKVATIPSELKEERSRVYVGSLREIHREEGRNTAIWALSIMAFFYVATVHRQWLTAVESSKKKWMLAGVANFCGYFPMACYMLWVKGVS